jgi:hypothetical protein
MSLGPDHAFPFFLLIIDHHPWHRSTQYCNIAVDLLLLLSTLGDSASTVWDESHSATSIFMPASGDPGRKAAWRAKHAPQ